MPQDRLFDLSLTEEQRMGRETLQRFVNERLRPVARQADEAAAPPPGWLETAAELGLGLMSVPEELGGLGAPRSPLSGVLNAEELGRGDLSLALAMTATPGVLHALLDFGSSVQQQHFLPRLLEAGPHAASLALQEGRARFDPGQLQSRAWRDGDEYVIDGEKRMVVLGAESAWLLVLAAEAGQPQAFLVPADQPGLDAEPTPYMGLRAAGLATVRLSRVRVPADHRLARLDLQRLLDLGRLQACAMAVGTCQAVLDAVTPHVLERQAFGEPIAHRQSVAFMVADMAIEIEAMRLLVWQAAARAEAGEPFHREAFLAWVQCADKAMQIGSDGVQLFGGMGFCRDLPLEMHYRNLRAIGVLDAVGMV